MCYAVFAVIVRSTDHFPPPAIISAALKLPYDAFLEMGVLQAIDEDYREQLGLA